MLVQTGAKLQLWLQGGKIYVGLLARLHRKREKNNNNRVHSDRKNHLIVVRIIISLDYYYCSTFQIMKTALLLLLFAAFRVVNGFVPQSNRPSRVLTRSAAATNVPEIMTLSTLVLLSAAALTKEPVLQVAWMPQATTSPPNDGIVSAMAMLKQAKLELLSGDNHVQYTQKSRAEQWEQSVFDAMERLELEIENRASVTGQHTLRMIQAAAAKLPRAVPRATWNLQTLETWERAVFDEMERLELFLENSASKTGAYSIKLIQAALESIRNIENRPEARRAKIVYTQKLASIVRAMADRLERAAEKEKLAAASVATAAVPYEDVLVTSAYRTRVRPTPRRRPGVITSFVSRMARKVSKLWHRL